jgi:hypothetical protein
MDKCWASCKIARCAISDVSYIAIGCTTLRAMVDPKCIVKYYHNFKKVMFLVLLNISNVLKKHGKMDGLYKTLVCLVNKSIIN